jgi:hypothetical protein
LVSASAESVDGLESADAGKLRVDRFDDHDVAAGGGRAQTLVGEERGGSLACRVVGKRERAFGIVSGCRRRRGDVTSG